MDFSICAEDQQRLQRLAQIGRDEFRPAGLRADRAGAPLPADDPFFQRMLALGFGRTSWQPPGAAAAAPRAPNKAGSAVAAVLLAEESAYWDRGVGVAMCGPGLGESPLLSMGTPEQQARFLTPFVQPAEPVWAAFAMSEPGAGSDVAGIRTRAVKDGNHWVLNGAKAWSGNARRALWTVVWATVDPTLGRAGHRAFVVERGTPGCHGHRIEKKMGLRAYESVSFFLDDCRVPADNLLGGEGYYAARAGFKGAMATFNAGRPAIGAMAVGIGRAALDETVRFARASGLWRHQRVRDRIEASRRRLKAALLLALRAAWLADQRRPNMTEASMAKASAPAAALDACQIGVDLLGEVAASGEPLLDKLHRDIKALDIVEGTGQIQRLVMARDLVKLPN